MAPPAALIGLLGCTHGPGTRFVQAPAGNRSIDQFRLD
jgi:hypothetical protein